MHPGLELSSCALRRTHRHADTTNSNGTFQSTVTPMTNVSRMRKNNQEQDAGGGHPSSLPSFQAIDLGFLSALRRLFRQSQKRIVEVVLQSRFLLHLRH